VDTITIPEKTLFLTLANSSWEWTTPSYADRRDYPPITVEPLVKAHAQDNWCHELRQEIDRNADSCLLQPGDLFWVLTVPWVPSRKIRVHSLLLPRKGLSSALCACQGRTVPW